MTIQITSNDELKLKLQIMTKQFTSNDGKLVEQYSQQEKQKSKNLKTNPCNFRNEEAEL